MAAGAFPSSAETWSPQIVISSAGEDASFPVAAMWGEGSATAIWLSTDSLPGTGYRIRTADLIGGVWSQESIVSDLGVTNSPAVAAASDGAAAAVWQRNSKYEGSSRQAPPAPLGAPTFVTPTVTGGYVNSFDLKLNGNGTGALAFEQGGSLSNQLKVFPITHGNFSSVAATITPSPTTSPATSTPNLLVASAGDFFAAYNHYDAPNTTAQLLGPMTTQATTFATYPSTVRNAVLGAHSSGVVTVWRDTTTQRYATSDGTGPAITFISDAGMDTFGPPKVASDGSGNVVAVWPQRPNGSGEGYRITAAIRPAGAGAFGPPVELSEEDNDPFRFPRFDVAAIAPDDFIATWDFDNGTTTQIEASRKRPGEAFQDLPDRLNANPANTANYPRVAGGGPGKAIVVWDDAARDGSGPLYSRVAASLLGVSTEPPDLDPGNSDSGPAPQLRKLRVSRARFAAGSKYNKVAAQQGEFTVIQPNLGLFQPLRVGTIFIFQSNVAGDLLIEIERGSKANTNNIDKLARRRVALKKGKIVLTINTTAKAGVNRIRFLGRGLRPGFYYDAEFHLTAAAKTSKSASVEFAVDAPAN